MILYDLERKEKNSECALMYMWPMTSKRKIALSLFVAADIIGAGITLFCCVSLWITRNFSLEFVGGHGE